jgi:hypothetical protein
MLDYPGRQSLNAVVGETADPSVQKRIERLGAGLSGKEMGHFDLYFGRTGQEPAIQMMRYISEHPESRTIDNRKLIPHLKALGEKIGDNNIHKILAAVPEFFELSEGKKLTVKDVLMPDHAFRLRGQPLALPSLGPTANQISNVAPNDPIIIAKRRLGSLNLPPAKHSASYTPRTTTELFENPQPTTLETNQSPSLVVRPIPLYHGNWPSRTAEPGNGLLPMATSGSTGNSAANYFPVANSETVSTPGALPPPRISSIYQPTLFPPPIPTALPLPVPVRIAEASIPVGQSASPAMFNQSARPFSPPLPAAAPNAPLAPPDIPKAPGTMQSSTDAVLAVASAIVQPPVSVDPTAAAPVVFHRPWE